MKQKGVYSYDYMDSFQKFNDKQLPPKEEFYSILTDEGISDVQYQHGQNVWNTFTMKTMGEYHDLYLKSDILPLAVVFEEKDFFKLLNNSVFGKTMENIRKRVDVRLVTDQKKLSKLVGKPSYVNSKIFNEDLVAVHKIKQTQTLDRPAYVGMCILNLSKTLLYDFQCNYVKRRYNNKAKLLFTDTDSLCY